MTRVGQVEYTEQFLAAHMLWLDDPHTVRVLHGINELCCRPAVPDRDGVMNETGSSLALGEVAGAWKVYDYLRDLGVIGRTVNQELPEPTYGTSLFDSDEGVE